MALNPTTLKSEIFAAMQAKTATVFPASVAGLATYHGLLAETIALAVVAHILANAVVSPTALLAPPGTLGGPVTGTGNVL